MTAIESLIKESAKTFKAGKYISFTSGRQTFHMDILKARGVVRMLEVSPIEDQPPYIRGSVNLRGFVMPLMDLKVKLGEAFQEYTNRSSILIVDGGDKYNESALALAVDSVLDIVELGDEDLDNSGKSIWNSKGGYITGKARVRGQDITLLDCDSLIGQSEKTLMARLNELFNQ
ncbi:MAG: chemotaxis protein CheW [Spirochaetota bacterium]|nr:chemotaxis protein CheW [Spirochaetota bacterium]